MSVRDRIFVTAPNTIGAGTAQAPSSDINPWLDDLVSTISNEVDKLAPEVYASIVGAKTPYKPFVVGIIPPDVTVNFVAIEQDKTNLGPAGKSSKGGSTVQGQSASGGTSSPTELVKTTTIFTQKALGNSIYNNLKGRGLSDADARRLTPLLVGQARAEIGNDGKGNFKTNCFNIGNVHSKGPGQGGYYYKSQDTYGTADAAVKAGKAKPGDPYEQTMVGHPTLDGGVNVWLGATLGWKEVRNAQNGVDFAKALRPDLFPESRGGNNGPYFTDGNSQDDITKGFDQVNPKTGKTERHFYAGNIQGGANRYSAENPDPSKPDPNGILTGGEASVASASGDLNTIDTDAPRTKADVMSGGSITTLEEDDPLGGRTGRNIRPAEGVRKEVVDAQVKYLQDQVAAANSTPALYMLISPQTFTRSYEHSVDTPKARRKHIVHMWLEKPMTISCKGVTAAQYIMDAQGTGGLTHQKRVHSLSYRNLMSLVRTYKNNGYLFSGSDTIFGSGNDHIRLIGMSIYIYFDGHFYIGSFDDFSVTDSSDKPYNLEYSFKFTVRYDMEVASTTDAQVGGSVGGR
jgi:hypothetical protein